MRSDSAAVTMELSCLSWFLNPTMMSAMTLHSGLHGLCGNDIHNRWYKAQAANSYLWVCTVDLPQRPWWLAVPVAHTLVCSLPWLYARHVTCAQSMQCVKNDGMPLPPSGYLTGQEGQSHPAMTLLHKLVLSKGVPCLLTLHDETPQVRSVLCPLPGISQGTEAQVCTVKSAPLTHL